MKLIRISLIVVGLLSAVFVASVQAVDGNDTESLLAKDSSLLDKAGSRDGGLSVPGTDVGAGTIDVASSDSGAAIIQSLADTFGVTASQISAFREDKLGYGEIAIILSLAQALPGGISEDSIGQVLSLRQGPPLAGWGRVAESLGLSLGKAVHGVERAVHSVQAIAAGQSGSQRGDGRGNGNGKKP